MIAALPSLPSPRLVAGRDEPAITYLGHDAWRLEQSVCVEDPARDGAAFVVPAGFVTDLASIPRALWNLVAPFELSIAAPIAHDWLYKHGGQLLDAAPYARAEADALFRSLMARAGITRAHRTAAYLAVRLFGGSSWRTT